MHTALTHQAHTAQLEDRVRRATAYRLVKALRRGL